jgi:hypothetical protein
MTLKQQHQPRQLSSLIPWWLLFLFGNAGSACCLVQIVANIFSLGCVGLVQFFIDSRLADIFLFATILLLSVKWMTNTRESKHSLFWKSLLTLTVLFSRPLLEHSNSFHLSLDNNRSDGLKTENIVVFDVKSMVRRVACAPGLSDHRKNSK